MPSRTTPRTAVLATAQPAFVHRTSRVVIGSDRSSPKVPFSCSMAYCMPAHATA